MNSSAARRLNRDEVLYVSYSKDAPLAYTASIVVDTRQKLPGYYMCCMWITTIVLFVGPT